MRILYLSQYFHPEVGATQMRALEMARAWVDQGADVTMVCEVPNHPSGIIPPDYRWTLFERATLDGIEIIRVRVIASPKKGFVRRMAFYLSYMVNATLAGLLLARGRFDLIYASSPPLFVGGAALALSLLKRTPMVFEVRDLWPESAVALGELSNSRAIRMAEWLEERCYRRARRIVAVAPGAIGVLRQRGIAEDKLLLVPNGANTEFFRFDRSERDRIRAELGLDDRFLVVFAGIHGLAQKLETVVEAAERLQSHGDIHFLLVGEGPRKAAIRTRVEELGLENITMLAEQPQDAMPAILAAADLSLVPMRDVGVLGTTMLPVKIYDAWACSRPVLLGGSGAAAAMIESAGGGVAVTAEDPDSMAAAILELRDQPERCREMGEAGRAYTERRHSRRVLADGLWDELVRVVEGESVSKSTV